MAVNSNPELIPDSRDREQELLYKLSKQFGSVDWEEITQRLQAIDGNTNELELTIEKIANSVSGTLSAPAEQAKVNLASKCIRNHVFTFDVANIDTDVTVGLYGAANGESTLARAGEQDSVITANGRYMLKVKNTPLSDIALRLVAESGGTGVTIENMQYRGTY